MTTGFVNFHVGGTGLASAPVIRELWHADKRAVPLYTVLVDTESANQRLLDQGTVDDIISLCLSPKKINAVLATPQSFGPTATRIVQRLAKLISPSSLGNGARTVRSLAQFMFEIRKDVIASQINRCLIRFRHKYGCQQFIPVFHTSSGGGPGAP